MSANAEIIAELRRVLNERDEARADLARSVAAWESAGMQGRTAHDAMLALAKERDEARAEVERLRTALLEVQTSESAPAWFADGFHDGWKAGAEAMREACAVRAQRYLGLLIVEGAKTAEAIRALPIPEEP